MSLAEIKAYVAFVLNIGIIQLPSFKEYWSSLETINISFSRSVMPCDLFVQILGMLHVSSDTTTHKGKIQPFTDLVMPKFSEAYAPQQQIAV